jgi:aconitate hydratase
MGAFRDVFKTLRSLGGDERRWYYSLPALEEQGIAPVRRLPVSIRILLESLLRNCDGERVGEEDVRRLARWRPAGPYEGEVPFVVARVLLQDFTGVPLLVDLAAMRDSAARMGAESARIEPCVPVDLVIDHSVQVDRSGTDDAFLFNLKIEFERNRERYEFLKWGQQAFQSFKVVPPGIGICHQVNLEHLACVVMEQEGLLYPDTLVGTDSHTTMINGLGVVGWGVGGIEAGAAMLGQPVTLQLPEVIGVHLFGALNEGTTPTDLTLRLTELLRQEKVVGKFVEFFGEGSASLTVADRAMIANMAPEYGATMGFFPVDEKSVHYLLGTGRDKEKVAQAEEYLRAQGLFGIPRKGEIDYTKVLELDLSSVVPCVSGPKRPQDRIPLQQLKEKFCYLLQAPVASGGYAKSDHPRVFVHSDGTFTLHQHHETGGKPSIENADSQAAWSESEMVTNRPFTCPLISPGYSELPPCDALLTHGSVVIAAITSCTNTSNPAVMIAAGLLAKKAVERGLKVNHTVKTSLAPGSRVVSDYLSRTGLQKYLDALGFHLVGYGCTTCIGNSGPLDETIEGVVKQHDLIAASVLSGNRNFEARIHSSVKANFLMSPPLVVAFALAGTVYIDMEKDPIGFDESGSPVMLKEVWPTAQEVDALIAQHVQPQLFRERYAHVLEDNPLWGAIGGGAGAQYRWNAASTYIQNPPYFETFTRALPEGQVLTGMRCLARFGDSVTTDHISPAGSFSAVSPAGRYLLSLGVKAEEFNSYGSRRGNHQVMMRGTFANVRIKNKMADGAEGGVTKLMPEGTAMPIFDACQLYAERKTPLIVFAGKDYGMGSSRDWAAKGTALLGVRAVVAQSFERIHRSNLVGMGVLPLEFLEGESDETLGIRGDELFAITGIDGDIRPHQEASLEITREGRTRAARVRVRIDTPIEAEYYRHGGIMPFVLRRILSTASGPSVSR